MTEADDRLKRAEELAKGFVKLRGTPHWHDLRDMYLMGRKHEASHHAEEMAKAINHDKCIDNLRIMGSDIASLRAQLQVARDAIEHYAKDGSVGTTCFGHGDYGDDISFYNGLKIKPKDTLAKLDELAKGGAG